jgi:hypothetical protein
VGLAILDHLQPVLDRPQQPVRPGQIVGRVGADPPRRLQRRQRVERCRRPQRRLSPAVDELVDLGEELDLADAAAAALSSRSRGRKSALGIMVADRRVIAWTSPIAPKSSDRRHTKG